MFILFSLVSSDTLKFICILFLFCYIGHNYFFKTDLEETECESVDGFNWLRIETSGGLL
jgi:hypothetical protein